LPSTDPGAGGGGWLSSGRVFFHRAPQQEVLAPSEHIFLHTLDSVFFVFAHSCGNLWGYFFAILFEEIIVLRCFSNSRADNIIEAIKLTKKVQNTI